MMKLVATTIGPHVVGMINTNENDGACFVFGSFAFGGCTEKCKDFFQQVDGLGLKDYGYSIAFSRLILH